MASLTDVVLAGEGKAHAWRVTQTLGVCRLWHYDTCMLVWNSNNPSDEEFLDYSLGWGSVSDQQGMNKAFMVLGIPRYYSRAGGAQINETDAENAKLIRDNWLRRLQERTYSRV